MLTIAEQGQDHGLLLRQPIPRQDTQAEVRGVWVRVQEGGLLGVQNQITLKILRMDGRCIFVILCNK